MTVYAGRYGSGPQIKPGSLTLALVATGLPIVALVAGLQIDKIVRNPGTIDTFFVPKDPPPPRPIERLKKPETKLPDEMIVVPKVDVPVIPVLPPIDLTPVRPSNPPGTDPIGKALEPTPPAVIEPVKPPVVVGVQITSMNAFQPPYPAEELRAGREGRVVVRVLVGADGRVKQVEKVAAASDAFYAATERQALGRWRFKPATRDGVPFEQWKTMSVRFELNGE